MHPRIEVSVIVPVHNGEAHIVECLESIVTNTASPREIIVIDDASSDSTRELVVRFGHPLVRLIALPSRLGPGGARNEGIRNAVGKALFFIDADCVASKEWIESGLKELEAPTVVGVYGSIYYAMAPCSIRERVPVNPFYHMHAKNPINAGFLDFAAANVAYKAEAAKDLGGFDTAKFPNGREDTDLGFRIRKLGEIRYCPQMGVSHMRSLWTWKHLRQSARRYRSDVAFFARYNDFAFRKGRVLHPRLLLFACVPIAIPFVFRHWLRTRQDWFFLPSLWFYFVLLRWHIHRAAWRERLVVF